MQSPKTAITSGVITALKRPPVFAIAGARNAELAKSSCMGCACMNHQTIIRLPADSLIIDSVVKKQTQSLAMARPSIFNAEVFAQICERLGTGEPLAQICRDPGMPSYSSVYAWQQARRDISEAIARARDEGEDLIAANCRNIARGKEGSSLDVQRDKLIIDTDLKLLAKWNPKKYGEKIQAEHSSDPAAPFTVLVSSVLDRDRRSEEEIPPPLPPPKTKASASVRLTGSSAAALLNRVGSRFMLSHPATAPVTNRATLSSLEEPTRAPARPAEPECTRVMVSDSNCFCEEGKA